MISSRRKFLVSVIAAGFCSRLAVGGQAFAGGTEVPFSVDNDRVAIQGYDTVAYFTDEKPIKGKPEYEFEWLGTKWRFATAEHRDLFASKPDAYAPRFGGFCAMGMTTGGMYPPDPEAWAVVDGKLYLNSDKATRTVWQKDTTGNTQKAEEQWKVLSQ
jgi:hypothetical protein